MLGPARKTSSSPMLGPARRAFTSASPCGLFSGKKEGAEFEEGAEGAEFEEFGFSEQSEESGFSGFSGFSEESEESEDRTHTIPQIPVYTVPTENVMDELQTSFDDLAMAEPLHVKPLTMQDEYAAEEMNLIVSSLSANMSEHVRRATEEYNTTIYMAQVAAEECLLNGSEIAHQAFLFRVTRVFVDEFRQFQKNYIVHWKQVVFRYMWLKWALTVEMTTMQNRAFNRLIAGFLSNCGTKAEPAFPDTERIEKLNEISELFIGHLGHRFDKATNKCLAENFFPAFFEQEPTEQQNAEPEEASGAIVVSWQQAVENMRVHTERVRTSARTPKLHTKVLKESGVETDLIMQVMQYFEAFVPEKITWAVQQLFDDVKWTKLSTTEHLMLEQDPGYELSITEQLFEDPSYEPNDLEQLMLEQQQAGQLMLEHHDWEESSRP